MVLLAPDMSSCTPKVRCAFGVNKGVAYDSTNPCPPGYRFSTHKCDCENYLPTGQVQARISGSIVWSGVSVPGDGWVTVAPTPYYFNGALVQYEWLICGGGNCSGFFYNSSPCFEIWPSEASMTLIQNCSSGSTQTHFTRLLEYRDGVVQGDPTACGYSTMQLLPATQPCPGTAGANWSATIEYRTSNGAGGWLPGVQ